MTIGASTLVFLLGAISVIIAGYVVWLTLKLKSLHTDTDEIAQSMMLVNESQMAVGHLVDAAIQEFRQTSAYQKRVLEEIMTLEISQHPEEGNHE